MSGEQISQRRFGAIVDPDSKRIIGLYTDMAELPSRIRDFIYSILGQPILRVDDDKDTNIWRLKHTLEYYSDEWNWLHDALEWHIADKLDFAWECRNAGLAEVELPTDGPQTDWSKNREPAKLLKDYRAYREALARGDSKSHWSKITGHQRVMYRTWAALEASDLKPVARLTLLVILKKCWSRTTCKMTIDEIAGLVGCDRRTIERSGIPPLAEGKWLQVTNTYMAENTYTILKKELVPPYVKDAKTVDR
jgi:hypothetical protein